MDIVSKFKKSVFCINLDSGSCKYFRIRPNPDPTQCQSDNLIFIGLNLLMLTYLLIFRVLTPFNPNGFKHIYNVENDYFKAVIMLEISKQLPYRFKCKAIIFIDNCPPLS